MLVLVEERLVDYLLAAFGAGSTVLQRYIDDLQDEGWEAYIYRYDVRSVESGLQSHRHLPSEVPQLYRYIRSFYHASAGTLSGVVLIGDFPAAGTCEVVTEQPAGNPTLQQNELDYFCVDAMLADPWGYWEWLPIAPMVAPGNLETLRLPYDEGLPPNGSLYPRNQWSPGYRTIARQKSLIETVIMTSVSCRKRGKLCKGGILSGPRASDSESRSKCVLTLRFTVRSANPFG